MKIFSCLFLSLCLPLVAFAAPKSAIDVSHFDRSVRFQDDLYMAANGAWLRSAVIPDDKPSWGIDEELNEQSLERTRELSSRALLDNPGDADAQRLSDFYASYMDEATVEKLGLSPLKSQLAAIAALQSTRAVVGEFGKLQQIGVQSPLAFGVAADAKDSAHYALYVSQSGLGLPDRDYYLEKDARFAHARHAYLSYLAKLFELDGQTDAAKRAHAILALETRLARVQWTESKNRDDKATYNKLDRQGLARLARGFPWTILLSESGVANNVNTLIMQQPSYARALAGIVAGTPVAVWRDYLTVHLLDTFAQALPARFAEAGFAFHDRELAGLKAQPPRWKRAVQAINDNLGEAAGRLYVAKYFPPESKARMDALVRNLMIVYARSIDQLSWMSPSTKARAHEKLDNYGIKIGYPSKWRDYSALLVKKDDLIGNLMRGAAFDYHRNIVRIGAKVDRSEWTMTPQTVNAYYDPQMNEIVFPAAILQPPYFDPEADDAANYGATGATIGHEISHGFDDQGSLYDKHGNMHNWWKPGDRKAFAQLTSRLVSQYNRYQPIPGRHVNGQQTLGENIADLSGLQIAYKAYHLALNGKRTPVIDGLTGDQRFFISYAQSWNTKQREAWTLQLLATDVHAPEKFRANGAAENSDGFQNAFATKPGDGMYKAPQDRIRIW
ncbi:MAG: M13 family metallopeptidase [Gallionella sp.]